MNPSTNAAKLRQQIESTLTARIPAALSPRGRIEPERSPSGIPAIDRLLLGGLPAGAVSELTGPESSGRTSVALSLLARVTDGVCAWIDVADAFDPETATASGIDLERLLWVRCGRPQQVQAAVTIPMRTPIAEAAMRPSHGGGSPHPRSESRGMPEAIDALLLAHGGLHDKHLRREKRSIGTPGAANRPVTIRPTQREEQIPTDRLPPRRGENLIAARCAEPLHERRREVNHAAWSGMAPEPRPCSPAKKPWDALDQALRAADLLLQGGGFGVIVLDLGSTPHEMAWRIPLATWFRFRAACERTRISLLVLTQQPCARSSAELVVRMEAGRFTAENRVVTGAAYQAERERQRFQPADTVVSIRKPPQSEREAAWRAEASWSNGR